MRHPFAFAPSYRLPALLLGITERTAWVEVADGELHVRYGVWRLHTAVDNVAGATRTGGFAWLKTVGPPHLSFADRGVSFTPNGDDALCVRFRTPVPGIDPTGLTGLRHPGATLGVADPEALRRDLAAAGASV
ncbi:MAG: hypothetical protein ACO1ON_03680 [Nocardioides sp.]|uniref:hypothetical protein n=1 Tax=Nocardioides sp. TaxID=35761 RepID=UPI0026076935|nr:hypothetical protein [Nocardioides sp.]